MEAFTFYFPNLVAKISRVKVDMLRPDRLIWELSTSGEVTCCDMYLTLVGFHSGVSWGKSLCNHFILPSRDFFCWRLFFGKAHVEEVLIQ